MAMRALRLPGDFVQIGDMLKDTFHYPDNPEWSFREDETEETQRMIRTVRRLWPLLRFLSLLSPPLRDVFRGFVWEEDGRIAAAVIVAREGGTPSWSVGMVGVLPEYRRRGLARKLLERSLEYLREREADKTTLGVIDRNVPAYSLYKSLGFDHYSGMTEYELTPTDASVVPAFPSGYVSEPVKIGKSWRVRYDLDKRITPAELTKYEPVEIGRYREPLMMRAFQPIMRLMQRRDQKIQSFREVKSGKIVGIAMSTIPKRAGGVCNLRIRLDPAHGELAYYLVASQLKRLIARGNGRRVDFMVPRWMDAVARSAESHGFTKRLEYHMLGLTL